jgi:hypothetical protein
MQTIILVGYIFTASKQGFTLLFKDFNSFRFLASDDLKARQLEFNGEKVNQACYYKLITSLDTVYYFQIDPATDNKIIS